MGADLQERVAVEKPPSPEKKKPDDGQLSFF
ncbi:hypothetical protein SAMN05216228_1004172 [Rhizobium tibeticum]|uniref:Uncharacterized protein n=2 Tax=Rhizobium TaxID=379 RepID=A0A1H8GCL3_9HYPH|nr:hypothetical protein RTCCBAU85039_1362 [Rhizobium tibeticum]SEN41048.1 hypothetical protein SAMN05216228_1004172 [Rhizobium tibeticum]